MELIVWWAMLAAASGAWAEVSGTSRVALGDWAGGMAEYGYTPDAPSTMNLDRFTTAFLNVTYIDSDGNWQSNKTEQGKFGQNHEFESYGVIVHVRTGNTNDHTGCALPLTGTMPIPTNTSWIALIKRGKCNFDIKVQNAFKHNASGVLVYNDRESEDLDKMKLSDKQRNISAVFTYKAMGEELARLADSGVKVMLNLTIANRLSRPPNHMNRTSVLFVSISFIVLMVMSLSWLVFYYIQRFRYIHAKDRLSKRLCCAAKKALSKIPVKNLKSEDKEIQGDGECCAVCIEPYKISDLLRALPCRHDFHKSCIDPWLLEHRTCPMCKMDILKYYGFVFTGSQESILQLDAEEGERRGPSVISPLPRQASRAGSYEVGHSERSSRASSPDELTPSLHQTQNLQSQPNIGDSPHYSKHHSSEKRKQQPSVHSTPSCSRHAVDTTIVSGERVGNDEARDAV